MASPSSNSTSTPPDLGRVDRSRAPDRLDGHTGERATAYLRAPSHNVGSARPPRDHRPMSSWRNPSFRIDGDADLLHALRPSVQRSRLVGSGTA